MPFHCISRADGVDFCIQIIHNSGNSEITNDDILAVEQTDPHLTLQEGIFFSLLTSKTFTDLGVP